MLPARTLARINGPLQARASRLAGVLSGACPSYDAGAQNADALSFALNVPFHSQPNSAGRR
jgi:hypothetical protein